MSLVSLVWWHGRTLKNIPSHRARTQHSLTAALLLLLGEEQSSPEVRITGERSSPCEFLTTHASKGSVPHPVAVTSQYLLPGHPSILKVLSSIISFTVVSALFIIVVSIHKLVLAEFMVSHACLFNSLMFSISCMLTHVTFSLSFNTLEKFL